MVEPPRGRSLNRLCDTFAAELLLPDHLFQPRAEDAVVCLATIDALAADFEASVSSTGSRFAAVVTAPCAFVLSENGKVRYASMSKGSTRRRPRVDRGKH